MARDNSPTVKQTTYPLWTLNRVLLLLLSRLRLFILYVLEVSCQLLGGYTHTVSSTSGIPSRLTAFLFVCFYIRPVVKHQPPERNSLRCPARFSSLFPHFLRGGNSPMFIVSWPTVDPYVLHQLSSLLDQAIFPPLGGFIFGSSHKSLS